MAINKYYTPKQSQYLPSTFDIYANYYQKQGAAYEQGMTSIDSLYTELGKMKAFKPEDEERLYQRKKYYEDRLNGLIEASNGKPMQMMPGLRDINREFINDLSSGPLAEINSNYARAANDYATYQKKVGEGKWDSFTQLMAQENIGTGMVFPDSPDKMKIIKENVNDQLANNMDFNSLTSVVAQTLLSDPSVMQQGQMMASLFGADSDYYKEWESNLMTTATSGALSKYKYTDKLQEMFDQLIDTEHVEGISAEELELKARLAAETAILEHSDYRQSLAQFAGPNADKVLEQYDKTAYDMALRTARIKWTEANKTLSEEERSSSSIYEILNTSQILPQSMKAYPNKPKDDWRNFSTGMKMEQINKFAENLNLEKALSGDYEDLTTQELQENSAFVVAAETGFNNLIAVENTTSDQGKQLRKDYKYYNLLPLMQAISYGISPPVSKEGVDLAEWDKDLLYDNETKTLGRFVNKRMFINSEGKPYESLEGESNVEALYKAFEIEGDSEDVKRDNLKKALETQKDKGTWVPFYWNGKEYMYGATVFSLLGKNNKEFNVAIEDNEAASARLKSTFGEIFETVAKTDVERKYEWDKKITGSNLIEYRGPGAGYVAKLNPLEIAYNTSNQQNAIGYIKAIDVTTKAQGVDGKGKPLRDGKGNILYDTIVKLKVYDSPEDDAQEVSDDEFVLNGTDELVNSLMSGYIKTLKETNPEGYISMLNLKPYLVKGKTMPMYPKK